MAADVGSKAPAPTAKRPANYRHLSRRGVALLGLVLVAGAAFFAVSEQLFSPSRGLSSAYQAALHPLGKRYYENPRSIQREATDGVDKAERIKNTNFSGEQNRADPEDKAELVPGSTPIDRDGKKKNSDPPENAEEKKKKTEAAEDRKTNGGEKKEAAAPPEETIHRREYGNARQVVGEGRTAADAGEARSELRPTSEEKNPKQFDGRTPGNLSKRLCDASDPRYDICDISGDVRTHGVSSTVFLLPPSDRSPPPERQEWSIPVQPPKYRPGIKRITVIALNATDPPPPVAACTSRHDSTAVVFALNNHTTNLWHAFSDVLVPLYLTAREFDGDVQLLVADLRPWFTAKYAAVLRRLSRHAVVDFSNDAQVRCYSRVVVGLRSQRDFGADEEFRDFLREAYGLPNDSATAIPYKAERDNADKKPRLMLVSRNTTRRFANLEEVRKGLEWFDFDVVVAEPGLADDTAELARAVDGCDVLMGVHGAGLGNMVFLRHGAVVIQVVPFGGLEDVADGFYGAPARAMGLNYVVYSAGAEESTLMEKFGPEHPVVRDPEGVKGGRRGAGGGVGRAGWKKTKEYYMDGQDVRLNMTRFGPTVLKALELIM